MLPLLSRPATLITPPAVPLTTSPQRAPTTTPATGTASLVPPELPAPAVPQEDSRPTIALSSPPLPPAPIILILVDGLDEADSPAHTIGGSNTACGSEVLRLVLTLADRYVMPSLISGILTV